MNAMSLVLTFLTNPRMLVSMGGLALVVMIYYFGPAFGLRGTPRLLVVGSLLLLYVILQVVLALRGRRRKDQAAADLETSMIMEADQSIAQAASGQKRAREDARRELVAAIEVLKKSNLADGRGGKAALYVLPWYVVLGSGYAGKSSLIANSGLQNPGKGPGDLRGIGASANCEWWFTNHAVFLEADRRFAATAGARAAEEDWETYLATLSKQRSRTALNGVVLTVSAADLMQGSISDLEDQARLLRKRLDALADQLKLVFPVYLVVTKMDLVQGCNEYFAGLAGAGADQIFGATLRASQMRAPHPEKIVGVEFERLYENLCRRRQMRLTQDEHAVRRDGTFLFPMQFRSLGSNLQRFVQTLCEPNAYGRNPLLRGFYFTSAGGDGEASDQVMHEMSRVLGLPAPAVPVSASERPLFMRGFFRKVLVPDRDIARPTRGAARRTLLMRRVVQVAALVALAGLIVNLCVAFGRSTYLIKQTEDRARGAATAVLSAANDRVPLVDEQLQKLDPLRLQLEQLDRADQGLGRVLWMGMNRGRQVNEAARKVYLKRFTDVVAEPYVKELERLLLAQQPGPQEYPEFYKRYQAYRMLFRPSRGDPGIVAEVLQTVLTQSVPSGRVGEGSLERLQQHVAFAMSHADSLEAECKDKLLLAPQVVNNANSYITDNWSTADYYGRLIAGVNRKRNDLRFDLNKLSQASTMLAQRGDPTRDGPLVVPASFTRRGWNEELRNLLGNIDVGLDRDAWLLPDNVKDTKAILKTELLNFYEADYVEHWQQFLTSIVLVAPSGMKTARQLLQNLQSEGSPYLQLLEEADVNLTLDWNDADLDQEVRDVLQRISESFGALHAHQDNDARGQEKRPQEEFFELVQALEAKLEEQSAGKEAAQNAAAFTRAVIEGGSEADNVINAFVSFADRRCFASGIGGRKRSNEAFESVLRLPYLHAWQAFLRDTERHLDELWRDEVYTRFNEDLKARYPFSKSASGEVGTGDFGEFFGGSGILKGFIDANLAPYIDARTYRPEMVHENGLRLTPSAISALVKGSQLREVFFSADDNNPQFSFTLNPEQALVKQREGLWVSRTFFTVGEQEYGFSGGSAVDKRFNWPPVEMTSSITVRLTDDNRPTEIVAEEKGIWGLFRMMGRAESLKLSSTKSRWTWRKKLADGPGELVVPYVVTFRKALHPFVPGLLDFNCPSQLHR